MTLAIGVDVGGSKIAAGVVDENGTVLARERMPTPATDVAAVARVVDELVRRLARAHHVEAVGVGAAGFVDAARASVLFAPNLAWRDEPLRAALEEPIGLPVVVENDANAAAWGEFRYGAGADVQDLLCVTLGTGIGGGIVTGGRLYRGGFGIAAEFGHLRVVPDGRRCGCGNGGCWEMYASGRALLSSAQALVRSGSPLAAALAERCGHRPEVLTGPMVTDAARAGDRLAGDLLADIARWLGEGIATLAAVLDPSVVVIGGGLSESGDLLLPGASRALERTLTGHRHGPLVELRLARLGNDAGLVGAADLARQP